MTPEDKELVERLRNDKIRGIYWVHDYHAEQAAAAIERLSAEVERQVEELGLLQTQMRNENERLSEENKRLTRTWEEKYDAEVKAKATARVWFTEAQKLRAQIAEAHPLDYIGELVADNDGYPWLRVEILDPVELAKAGKGAKVYLRPAAGVKDAESLQQQRDALLTALESIAKDATSTYEDAWCGDIAREAITKVKGKI